MNHHFLKQEGTMPIINHNQQPRIQSEEFSSLRPLVTKDHGAASLTIQEVTITPGMAGRLQTHPVDMAFMMLEGSIQMIVGNEVRTVRSGNTLLAPPGTPYKLINNTWVPARLLMIFPAAQLETKILE
jgi:quercetin dioxygenase-like cupin family protein